MTDAASPMAMPAVAPPPDAWDVQTDVLVIGAGAAGLVAGLRALEAGAETLVLEREPKLSGSTSMSSGFVPAPGTRWQRAHDIEDDPDRFAADIQKKAANGAHPGIVATVTSAIGPALEWTADQHGLEWDVLTGFLYSGHTRHRMHAVPERTGQGLITRLGAAADAAGLPCVTQARATCLHMDGDRAAGITVERPDGTLETIGAKAIVLACNGYGGNRALVERHIPEIADGVYHGHPGNTGDAILWGQQIGAASRDLTGYQGHGNLAHPHGILITWALMMEGGIQVNAHGKRFSNEHEGYSEQGVKVLAQPSGIAWSIYDARLHELGLQFPDYQLAVQAGAVRRGDSDDLAAQIGVPADALAQTLGETRTAAMTGATDQFGRDFSGAPPLGDDLFAIRVTGALFHTQGGLDIDSQARVCRPDGAAFDNLFAVGGAACGVSGNRVEGYLSGNGLLTAVGLGWIAGRAAALAAGKSP